MKSAVIDIGTNSVLLLVVDRHGSPVIDLATITRIGQGIAATEKFHPEGMRRTLESLRKYKTLCNQEGVANITVVGTAAFRKATNAVRFIDSVRQELGLNVEIISGEREASLIWKSCTQDFGENIVIVDVGGGSTEVVSHPDHPISLPIGSVVLFEKHVTTDPISEEEYQNICDEIDLHTKLLEPFNNVTNASLVATAGSATTLSAIHKKIAVYNHSQVHGSKLTRKEIEIMIAHFKNKTLAERKKIIGLEPGRADVILIGATILKKCTEHFGAETITVSDRGVRWGLMYEFHKRP